VNRMLGVSFYIVFRSSIAVESAPSLIEDLNADIKASIENNVLLEVLQSLGSINNCTFRSNVAIVGLNDEVELFDKTPVDVFSACDVRLQSNQHTWHYMFSKPSYGVWLILLTVAYGALLLVFIMMVLNSHPSCLVYGTANSTKFKHLWSLFFSLMLIKLLFFITVLASWQRNEQSSFACTERFFITGTSVSATSLSLLQLLFLPITFASRDVVCGLRSGCFILIHFRWHELSGLWTFHMALHNCVCNICIPFDWCSATW